MFLFFRLSNRFVNEQLTIDKIIPINFRKSNKILPTSQEINDGQVRRLKYKKIINFSDVS